MNKYSQFKNGKMNTKAYILSLAAGAVAHAGEFKNPHPNYADVMPTQQKIDTHPVVIKPISESVVTPLYQSCDHKWEKSNYWLGLYEKDGNAHITDNGQVEICSKCGILRARTEK